MIRNRWLCHYNAHFLGFLKCNWATGIRTFCWPDGNTLRHHTTVLIAFPHTRQMPTQHARKKSTLSDFRRQSCVRKHRLIFRRTTPLYLHPNLPKIHLFSSENTTWSSGLYMSDWLWSYLTFLQFVLMRCERAWAWRSYGGSRNRVALHNLKDNV